jgi:hypothetical protein
VTNTTTLDAVDGETSEHPEAIAPSRRYVASRAFGLVRDAGMVVLATLLPLAIHFRFWDGGFRVPYTYYGDANFYGGVTQNIIDTGWYQTTDRLGAPFGQELYDFALGGDNFHWLVLRVLTIFSQDWALVTNVFYLLTFVASALTAFFVCRWLGAGRLTSLVVSVLFAFAPYHFLRGTGHLAYASYAIVPIGVALAVRTERGKGPFWDVRRSGRQRWLLTLGWIVAAVLTGSCNAYYAVFSILLIITASLVGAVARSDSAPIAAGAMTVLVIVAALGANLAPSILYEREHGDNVEVANREPQEVDYYGLRVIQLVTPVPDHRLAPLRDLSNDLRAGPFNSEASMFLGLVGSVALFGMLGTMLVRVVRPASGRHASDDDEEVRPLLSVFTLVVLLVATIGGLAWFIAIAGLQEIRGWNRSSIVVAFLVLAWLALTVDRLRSRRAWGRRGRAIAIMVAVAVIGLGIADQTGRTLMPDWRDSEAEYHADRGYFTAVERRLPTGASVFQLPYVPYPEAGTVVDILDYDPLRPYLHTQELRWSYGGMKGREADWQQRLVNQPVATLVDDVVAAGFSGLLVDTYGYADRAPVMLEELREVTGDPGFASPNGRWVFFDLADATARYERGTGAAERAERRAAVLEPVTARARECYAGEVDARTAGRFQWCAPDGQLVLEHLGEQRRYSVDVRFFAASGPATIELELPGGVRTFRTDTSGAAEATFEIALADGETVVPYTSDAWPVAVAGDSRSLSLRIDEPMISPAGVR